MGYTFEWDRAYFEIIIVLLTILFSFLLYLYSSNNINIFYYLKIRYGEQKSLAYWVYFQKFLGMFFFGIIPIIIVLTVLPQNLTDYSITLIQPKKTFISVLIFASFIIPANLLVGRKPGNLRIYPQIRRKEWNIKILILSALTWAGYLLAYEFLFRGFLLFACIRTFGIWPAITIVVVIYSLVHIPKGKSETIGAIPFGLLLCILTIYTGSFWIAFFIHITLALSNEWISLYFNKEINFIKSKK